MRTSSILTFSFLALLISCGGNSLKVDPISTTENPHEQIEMLETSISKARLEKVDVLSPTWLSKAERSLSYAKRLQDRGRSLSDMLKYVAKGKAQLRNANAAAKVARTALAKSIQAREDARNAGATSYVEEYKDVEEDFLELTKAIERNSISRAKNREDDVVKRYRVLELRGIKEKTLGKVRELIREAKAEDAQRVAKVSLALAEKKLSETDAFISKHRYNKEVMVSKADDALFFAQRLFNVNRQIHALQDKSPEEIVIWMEKLLSQISRAAGAPDMRNQNFKTQVENISASIQQGKQDQKFFSEKTKTQEKEISALKRRVAALEGTTQAERAAKAKLEAERKFQALYSEVRKIFDPREAEVYKEDDRLLIRLKKMDFPVGQSVIMPKNYSLLGKVQRAIWTFGEPKVVIEGHSDSTGSESLNEHLSQKRAEAVRSYLIANRTLPQNLIMSLGYGSSKPLASNKTRRGRAMNRRIDIVIKPKAGNVQ